MILRCQGCPMVVSALHVYFICIIIDETESVSVGSCHDCHQQS